MRIRDDRTGTLRVDLAILGATVLVSLHGEVDLAGSAQVQRTLRRAERATSGPIVIDLGGVEFIDLTGLRVLLEAAARLDGRLKLLAPSEPAQRLFEITNTAGRLPIARTPAARVHTLRLVTSLGR